MDTFGVVKVFCKHLDSNLGPSSQHRVAIPTALRYCLPTLTFLYEAWEMQAAEVVCTLQLSVQLS